MNRAFVDAVRTLTVIRNSSKLHSQAIFWVARLDKVTRIMTAIGIDQDIRDEVEKLRVEVLVASPDDAAP